MTDPAKLFDEIQEQWSTKKGLFLVLVVLGGFLLWIFTAAELAKMSRLQWLLGLLVMAAVTGLWWFTRLPRVPRGRVGFGIAIVYEDAVEGSRIQADFVARLRELIQGSESLRRRFHFIECDARLARRFVDGEAGGRLAARTNCHFVIYGRAQSRVVCGGPSHVIELRGFVRHAPVEPAIGKIRIACCFLNSLPVISTSFLAM